MDGPPEPLERSKLTFSQAAGLSPLPTQLALDEISQELRSRLWLVIFSFVDGSKILNRYNGSYELNDSWKSILHRWHLYHENQFIDDIKVTHHLSIAYLKAMVKSGTYNRIFDFIQFSVRQDNCPIQFPEQINLALQETRSPYRVIDKTVVPVASVQEGQSIRSAFDDLDSAGYDGARSHLRMAAEFLTNGEYAQSIRESISGVESVARKIEPTAKTLSDAMKKLGKASVLNPNLTRGFNALYDYTSDENGIRHALLDGPVAAVDEADAIYMFGACASFISYLVRKTASI